MFTSRAEFRLSLRADNADLRLTGKGVTWGCVGSSRQAAFSAYRASLDAAMTRARTEGAAPAALSQLGIPVRADGRWRSVLELAGHDSVSWDTLAAAFPWLLTVPPSVAAQMRADARYAGYLHRQDAEIRVSRREEAVSLDGVSFEQIGGLSAELRDKLIRSRPESLGAASRIQGMTPAAMACIAAHLRKRSVVVAGSAG
jgi:tRNA uridine 5-carboxymethylaminomethyl modification enzyme